MSGKIRKSSKNHLKQFSQATLLLTTLAGSVAAQTTWVNAPPPASRPQDAPKITEVQHSAEWRAGAQFGIEAPVPDILKFLETQGNWYTPFNQAGMVGPYDIRNWHSQK